MHNQTRNHTNNSTTTKGKHTPMPDQWSLDDDPYADYAEDFNPARIDRKARRKRKPRANSTPKKSQVDIVNDIADAIGLESGFDTTYQPSKYESGWLLQSISSLYNQQLITDVLAQVKGGKEASVYCCRAHETTGETLLAAKVYRPRMFRQLRNDKMYRQGREVIMGDGLRLNANDFREMRAIIKRTGFGRQLMHQSWLMHEYETMQQLYAAGANVPKPWAAGDNVILMEYVGDEHMAAPMLNTVRLERDEAEHLFTVARKNIEIMLQHGLIHGDLSAYNILYWNGELVLIDFPQVTNLTANDNARFILERDVTRICEYFAAQGVTCDPADWSNELWFQFGHGDL